MIFLILTSDAKLDEGKLINYSNSIVIYDSENNQIESASLSSRRKSIKLEDVNNNTINAFIASEDRTFFEHNGLNYKRMIKALYKNILSRSFKEGASTISQQLIKNTHLSNDKTISRKLKEIRLTKQLEKKYSKNDILEMYLNTIYFGHNCYGLESAANFYFDKNAEDLTIEESATLVGLLTSPNNYSPFKNEEKCIKRRNTVLKSMLDCNYLSENEYKKAKNAPLNTKKSIENGKYNDYINAVLDELDEMDLGNYNIAEGCKIVTGLNTDIQNLIENEQFDCDNAIIITNKNGEINAFKSTIGSSKRQIGSTIKPILVYAPAIEEKIVHPFTKIIDEKIDFNGYSPENYDKKYHGAVTVSKCLQQSYNVPSVKLLNNLTIEKAEKYAKLMGITLENEEKNLALALGGMKYGLSLQEICDSYSTFQNEGNMVKASFIKEIIGINGEIVYKRETEKRKVFSDGTSSLMNEILIGTSKTGTGKKLKNFDFDIATKTGTCGNESGNTDAYAISYTSSHIIGLWLGDKNNQRLNITGGNDCCEYTIKILTELYNDSKPTPLEKEKGTAYIEIDKEEYDKNDNIIIADEVSPMLNKMKVKCLKSNIPKEVSTRFSLPKIKKTAINVTNDSILIVLCQTEYYYYLINRVNDNEKTCIYDGKWSNEISDTPDDGYCFYEVTPYYFDGKNKYFGKTETTEKIHFIKNIGQNNLPDTDRLPDIAFKDWYNQ